MIIIPGEPEPKPLNSLLSTEMFKRILLEEFEDHMKAMKQWRDRCKVWELRKSCGVAPSQVTVSVRLPPRYAKD